MPDTREKELVPPGGMSGKVPKRRTASDPDVRRTMLGGSDAPKVMGLCPWVGGTPLDLYMEKLGLTERDGMSEAAQWGLILEPVLLAQYAKVSGHQIIGRDTGGKIVIYHPDGYTHLCGSGLASLLGTLRHGDHDFIGCHLDGIVLGNEGYAEHAPIAIVEVKTAGTWVAQKWNLDDELTDEIPEEYIIQCQHESMVVESVTGDRLPVVVPTLIGGQKFRVFNVEPNDDLQSKILEAEIDLWDRIERRHPPQPMDTESGKRSLATFYPEHAPDSQLTVDARHQYSVLADQLYDAKQVCKGADAAKVAAENALKAKMGNLSLLYGPGYRFTWRTSKNGARPFIAKFYEEN